MSKTLIDYVIQRSSPGHKEKHIFCHKEMGPVNGVYTALCGYQTNNTPIYYGVSTCVVCHDIEPTHFVGG